MFSRRSDLLALGGDLGCQDEGGQPDHDDQREADDFDDSIPRHDALLA